MGKKKVGASLDSDPKRSWTFSNILVETRMDRPKCVVRVIRGIA